MAKPVSMAQMNAIFEVTDRLGMSREVVAVPLAPQGEGSVEQLPGGKVRIVVPATRTLEEWLPAMRARLIELLG